jgi:6-phosphofructokinase 1
VSTIRRLAVLTSGTDGPGMNAVIRAVVRKSLEFGWSVLGVNHGYAGLLRSELGPLDSRSVSHRIDKGGTFLGTSRGEAFPTQQDLRDAQRTLNEENVDALVAIGGPSCARGALQLAASGMATMLVPASIENDLWGTDQAIGVDTAINTAMDAVDRIKDAASSQQQAFVIEMAGTHSGYLTLMAGLVGGAEITCIPEAGLTLEEIAAKVADTYVRGKEHCIIVVAERAVPDAHAIQAYLSEHRAETGFEANLTMLGHIQRGGSPMATDRYLATVLGATAVEALARGESGAMVGIQANKTVLVPLAQVVEHQKQIDPRYLELAGMLAC